MKKYIVRLSTWERETLTKLTTSGRHPARMFTRARILLKADQGDDGPAWSDEKISEALEVTNKRIVDLLGGLPKEKHHCSVLAEDGIKKAIDDYQSKK